jgi:hypothetical protein
MKLTDKQKAYLAGGVGLLVVIAFVLMNRAKPNMYAQNPTGEPIPSYLDFNIPPYVPGEGNVNTYGGITYVTNPPGNCGGNNYFVSTDSLANAQGIIAAQNLVSP